MSLAWMGTSRSDSSVLTVLRGALSSTAYAVDVEVDEFTVLLEIGDRALTDLLETAARRDSEEDPEHSRVADPRVDVQLAGSVKSGQAHSVAGS